jgi:hypothetical protein
MSTVNVKINNKKNELKTLEQLQRKKDEIIEELEVQAGKDKKVIKEVIVDKVRDNAVDEMMEEIMGICKVPIRKISENYFEFGTKKIYVKLDPATGEVRVRDKGGRYIEVTQYVRENEDQEYERILKGETRFSCVNQSFFSDRSKTSSVNL